MQSTRGNRLPISTTGFRITGSGQEKGVFKRRKDCHVAMLARGKEFLVSEHEVAASDPVRVSC
jgi:hypothetical protein